MGRIEILQRVLMRRAQTLAGVDYDTLLRALPDEVRIGFEDVWRSRIRAHQGVNHVQAYQEALLEEFPGVYFLIVATEYVQEKTLLEAVAEVFRGFSKDPSGVEKVFEIAEELRGLSSDLGRRRPLSESQIEEAIQPDGRVLADVGQDFSADLLPADAKPLSTQSSAAELAEAIESFESHPPLELIPGTRPVNCVFCNRPVSSRGIVDHIQDVHFGLLRAIDGQKVQERWMRAEARRKRSPDSVALAPNPSQDWNPGDGCRFCGKTTLPGEFTCFLCAQK